MLRVALLYSLVLAVACGGSAPPAPRCAPAVRAYAQCADGTGALCRTDSYGCYLCADDQKQAVDGCALDDERWCAFACSDCRAPSSLGGNLCLPLVTE